MSINKCNFNVYQIMKKFKQFAILLILVFTTNNLTAQWSGNGTQASPYLINDSADMISLSTYVNSGNSTIGKYFILTNDINLANVPNFVPIGGWNISGTTTSTNNQFKGNFDGNGKTIKNLTIHYDTSNTTKERIGLFGYVGSGAKIYNLGVVNASIRGNNGVGVLCGYANTAIISKCYSSGKTTAWIAGGGLCGFIEYCTIESCYSKVNINGNSYICGFIGHSSNSTVKNNYSIGNAIGTIKICGFSYNNNCTYSNNFFKSNAVLSGTTISEFGTPILDSLMKVNDFIDSVNKGLITTSFKMDIFNYNNGYPILFWQDSGIAIITKNVSEIKDSSAKINANILYPNLANIISKGFYYKKVADSNWSIVNGIGDTNMYANLTGLIPNTSYEFKAFFVSSLLTTYIGEVLSFKTLHTPAKINTDSATFILTSSATLNGRIIIGSEPILTTGFKYKRASATSYLIIYTFESDTLEADISGLLANTEYTFKAFATTPSDTIYGEDINFITTDISKINDEKIDESKLIIYPNPAKEYIDIQLQGISTMANIKIIDIRGRVLFSQCFYPLMNNINPKINISNLDRGVYILNLSTQDSSITKKIIIE